MIRLTKFASYNPPQPIYVNPQNIKSCERIPLPNYPTIVRLMDGTSIQVAELPARIATLMRTSQN